MAELERLIAGIGPDDSENKENELKDFEPQPKKPRIEDHMHPRENKLEERLSGILCCAVCLDLPKTCYQCINGHLMCAGCYNHLLADARLKDETATCPNCRCEINKNSCTRNLAVEKAISELPTDCQYCCCKLPRNTLEYHEKEMCEERPCSCTFARIGCPWRGPHHELNLHESLCAHPHKTGKEIMESIASIDQENREMLSLYDKMFGLLSIEKITFNDLQLRPYRTDDFLTKLFYESSRFSAFNTQWVIKAKVNNDAKNPEHTCSRSLTYQIVVKSRLTNPVGLKFMALKGPFSELKVKPAVYEHEFSNDSTETAYFTLPVNSVDCNKMLAAKTINIRMILFQV